MGRSTYVGIAVAVAFAGFFFRFFLLRPLLQQQQQQQPSRLFTSQELALYNGTDEQLPIFLGILGSVYDVTKGKSHYGVGGAYNHFAGRDASRAFVSGNFTGDGLTDTLRGLSSSEVKSVVEWRDFFSRTYTFVGKLVGRYYDYRGKPTKYLKSAEAKAARGAQLMEKQKKEEEKIPNCNSKWSEHEGGEVIRTYRLGLCDDMTEGYYSICCNFSAAEDRPLDNFNTNLGSLRVWCEEGYPRLMQRPLEIALTGKMSKRCVCMKEEDLELQGLEIYQGCDYHSKACKV